MFGKNKEEKERKREEKALAKIKELEEKERIRKEKEGKKSLKLGQKQVRLKRNTGIKILKIAVWGIFLLFAVRGAIAATRPDPISEMKNTQKKFQDQVAINSAIEERAFAFAEDFAREYFTLFDGKYDDYKNRLSGYMAKEVIDKVDSKGCMDVQSVAAYDFKRYSDNQVDVLLHAVVLYKVEVAPQGQQQDAIDIKNKTYNTSKRDVYIDIPIYYTSAREMVVEDIPLMINKPSTASLEADTNISNDTLNGNEADEVKKSLTEFFKAYYQESQTQVDYFLTVPGSIRGTDSRYKFNSMDECTIYNLGSKKYKAVVVLKVDDVGKTFRQQVNVNLAYKNDRYMIESLDTRSKNLKN
ncbi:conjugal transfer protein [Clostridium saccharoperbutylacetonicum]|uniref:conjugal transfer protein n=1 Tax=Clostridium saccharoperbutylacetonicum TaxID=36745 RepID=UPI0039EB60CB